MRIEYAESFYADFEEKLAYFKNFDKQEGTVLELKLFKRISKIKSSLLLFPNMGRKVGEVHVLSLADSAQDIFRNIELRYMIHEEIIVFLHLFHTKQSR